MAQSFELPAVATDEPVPTAGHGRSEVGRWSVMAVGEDDETIDLRERVDPLAGRPGTLVHLVHDLSDEELEQFLDYWRWRREMAVRNREGLGTWWVDKHLRTGEQELAARRPAPA